jgi:hypothetical protein
MEWVTLHLQNVKARQPLCDCLALALSVVFLIATCNFYCFSVIDLAHHHRYM